jgi:hypothetical protein
MTLMGQPHLFSDTLPSDEEHRYLSNRRLSGSEFRSKLLGKVKNILFLLGYEPQNFQLEARSLCSRGCPKVFYTAFLLFKYKDATNDVTLDRNSSLADAVYCSDWESGGGYEFGDDVTRTNEKYPAAQVGS